MLFQKVFITAAAPFIVAASAIPIAMEPPLLSGYLNASQPLSKRLGIPSECRFMGSRGSWHYIQLPGGSCFGWPDNPVSCGPSNWSGQELADIKAAVDEQVTKDGWLKGSKHGKWTATFFVGTTAFKDRSTHELFDKLMDECAAGKHGKGGRCGTNWQYFFNGKGDEINVMRSGGILNPCK